MIKKRNILFLFICAAFVVFMHGYLDIFIMCDDLESGYVYCDSMRDLDLKKTEMKRVYYCDENKTGGKVILGLDEKIVRNIVYRKLYNSLGEKDVPPYLFRKMVPANCYEEAQSVYGAIMKDVRYFPIPLDIKGNVEVSYDNSWQEARKYGGDRAHEGTDIMAGNNQSGYFPVVSMTDGVVEKKGWLELGGYRLGIRSASGAYYYYAHLAEYADGIEEGKEIKAGDVIGTMGDTGYGVEGTVGQFAVHLHLGIYVNDGENEVSFNPYYVLKTLEKYRLEFVF